MAEAQAEAGEKKPKGPVLKWESLPPMPTARVYCSSLWHDDGRLYVFGGCDQMGRALTVAESYNPANGKWLSLPKMPHKRAGGRLVSVSGRLVLIGGIDGAQSSVSTVDAYNPKTGSWDSLKRLPDPLSSPSVIVVDGEIYLFGGAVDSSKPPSNKCMVFNIEAGTWTPVADMPTARYGGEPVRRENKIYIFGGRAIKDAVLAVDVFDLSTKTWLEPLAPIPTPRVFWSIVSHEDEVFVIGGFTEDSGFRSQVEVFSLSANKWEIARPLKMKRGDFACGVVSGCVAVAGGMGGEKDSGLAQAERMRLRTSGTRKWTSIDPLPEPRLAPTSFVHENKLYVIGGFGIGGPKPSVYALYEA